MKRTTRQVAVERQQQQQWKQQYTHNKKDLLHYSTFKQTNKNIHKRIFTILDEQPQYTFYRSSFVVNCACAKQLTACGLTKAIKLTVRLVFYSDQRVPPPAWQFCILCVCTLYQPCSYTHTYTQTHGNTQTQTHRHTDTQTQTHTHTHDIFKKRIKNWRKKIYACVFLLSCRLSLPLLSFPSSSLNSPSLSPIP